MKKPFRIGILKIGVLVALLGFVASCQTVGEERPVVAAQAIDVPKYRGVIKPIISPIALRYRPFPKSPASEIKQFSIPNEGKENLIATKETSGVMEGKIVDGLLLITAVAEMPLENETASASMQYTMTQSGQFQDFIELKVNGIDMLSYASSKVGPTLKQFKEALRTANPTYDKVNGYVTGDNIYDFDLNINLFNYEMAMKTHGVVRGLTVYGGRDAPCPGF